MQILKKEYLTQIYSFIKSDDCVEASHLLLNLQDLNIEIKKFQKRLEELDQTEKK
ncbi:MULTISPECIES: hypothetical protein [Methanobrevibacter]|uniref:hypothetical protein n=1 Tax=Methanobrevibacter TaxID=2172 RepID=UPI00375AE500|nr:hypothetical protein [Methanobacteriaceae archaeon]